jgi:hypothetical protein
MEDYEHIELGIRHGYGGDTPFSFTLADRRHHTYIIGKTGVGKSTLLLNTICEDIRAGRGVGVIDPHGPLAREVLNCVPKSRTEDVVYFDPSDADYPISWNLLKAEHPERKHLVASGIVAAFKSMWHDSWGPRLEYILYASVATLMECENASLIGISRLLSDPEYRRWALKQVKDPGLLSFWQYEFERYDERFLREAIAPIQNKVGRLLLTPVVRNIFGQVKSKVSARFMMDNRRIFIANLAKGAVGEDTANLLGALLVTQFEQAAMSRIDQGEEALVDFHLVVDEFQSFATDSFEGILSEARKYRLSLTLAHQYIDQLAEPVRRAVFGNVGTIISFRVGERDAAVLAREFGNTYGAEHFTDLGNHEICVKLLQHGDEREPFTGTTFPPQWKQHGRTETIIARSRERYTTSRAVVEEKIGRWMQPAMVEQSRRRNGLRRKPTVRSRGRE